MYLYRKWKSSIFKALLKWSFSLVHSILGETHNKDSHGTEVSISIKLRKKADEIYK